jgi:hypothetical protein
MSFSLIFQVILAIPKIWSLISGLVKSLEKAKLNAKQAALAQGVLDAQAAKTKEEMQKSNEESTRGLP